MSVNADTASKRGRAGVPVAVIGGGWAGCAAAWALSSRGIPVVLHEAAGQAGGRCRSFHDDKLDRRIDNGNIRNGAIVGGTVINEATTGNNGTFSLRLPTGTDPVKNSLST